MAEAAFKQTQKFFNSPLFCAKSRFFVQFKVFVQSCFRGLCIKREFFFGFQTLLCAINSFAQLSFGKMPKKIK